MDTKDLRNLRDYSLYMQGVRVGIQRAYEQWSGYIKGENKIYARAEYNLFLGNYKDLEKLLQSPQICDIRYRNHERNKSNKLINVEAYYGK